jgi:Leucine-rich repeat (LRR) protein
LDIGFNLMTELPVRAFEGNPSITLLAIDGNPLSSVPEEAFAGLVGTLRGLSLGGRFLMCDCKLRWIVEWIHTRELQVTSRESKPQFCGSPQRLQDKSFYAIKPEGEYVLQFHLPRQVSYLTYLMLLFNITMTNKLSRMLKLGLLLRALSTNKSKVLFKKRHCTQIYLYSLPSPLFFEQSLRTLRKISTL